MAQAAALAAKKAAAEKETLAVALFLIWDEGRFEYVSILALLIAFLSLVPVALVRRFVRLGETREIF